MKRIVASVLIVLALLIVLTGCNRIDKVTPNGKIAYNSVTTIIDDTNMMEVVGSADYVFVGVVEKLTGRLIDNDFPLEYYSIIVLENLKGSLISDESIEVYKQGGYTEDGTLVLYASDSVVGTGLCDIGGKYIFIGFGQYDGSLMLDYLHGNVDYIDELENEYLYYIENQVDSDRVRNPARYDPAYED